MAENLPRDGLVAVVKRDCPTCVLAARVLGDLARDAGLTVYTQDDPSFPETVPGRIDDTSLDVSHRLKIEIVPTLIRFAEGGEVDRTYGWDRSGWERLSGIAGLGLDLPEARPGCGAKNVEPGAIERLKIRFNETGLKSRRIAIGEDEDEHEAMFARGWSDGLPLVPPTEERVLRILDGTSRDPQEVLGSGATRPRPGNCREGRDQRGDGRLQAGISAGRAGRGRGGARRAVRDARRAGDDNVCRAGRCRQRPDSAPHRHERQGQCAGPRQPRQWRDRPRLAIGDPQCRRRPAAGGRPRDIGQSRQIYLLLCRGRGGIELGAVVGRARRAAGPVGGDGVRRLWPAGRRRPEIARPREPVAQLCRLAEGDPQRQIGALLRRAAGGLPGASSHLPAMPAGRRHGSTKSSTSCARSQATSSSPGPRALPKAVRLRSPARPSTSSVQAG